jgi:adenosylmethionine-8-amino-7-oxononanoate aminotransferase
MFFFTFLKTFSFSNFLQVTRAEGVLLFCANGQTLIDGISSWWVTTHGYSEPRIMEAIAKQAKASLD